MNELFLIGGVSGSGKSTTAAAIAGRTGVTVAADDFRYNDAGEYVYDKSKHGEMHRRCQNATKEHMRLHMSPVIVHNLFMSEKQIRPYLELAKQFNYRVHVLTAQNYHNGESEHNVPDEHRISQAQHFGMRHLPERLTTTAIPELQHALDRLKTLPQRPDYHPEIWVYDHIAYVGGQILVQETYYDAPEDETTILFWTAIMHDLAKWDTFGLNTREGHKSYGAITSYGHAEFSAEHYCPQILPQYIDDPAVIADITWMVKYHMRAHQLQENAKFTSHRLWPLLQQFSQYDDMVNLFRTTDGLERQNYKNLFEQRLHEHTTYVPTTTG